MKADRRAIDNLKYVMERGKGGAHLLFDASLIRSTFADRTTRFVEASQTATERVSRALGMVTQMGTVREQRAFLSCLPPEVQEDVCFHYFQLLERNDEPSDRIIH